MGQSSTNLSNVNPSHKLQFFQSCSIMSLFYEDQSVRNTLFQFGSPPRVTGFAPKPAPVRTHLHSLQFLQEPALAWALPQAAASFRAYPHAPIEVLHGLQLDTCFTRDLHGLQGNSQPHHGPHHGLQGISNPVLGVLLLHIVV